MRRLIRLDGCPDSASGGGPSRALGQLCAADHPGVLSLGIGQVRSLIGGCWER